MLSRVVRLGFQVAGSVRPVRVRALRGGVTVAAGEGPLAVRPAVRARALTSSALLRVGSGREQPAPGATAPPPPPPVSAAEERPLDETPIDHFDETGFTTLPQDAEAVLKRRTREELYEELHATAGAYGDSFITDPELLRAGQLEAQTQAQQAQTSQAQSKGGTPAANPSRQ